MLYCVNGDFQFELCPFTVPKIHLIATFVSFALNEVKPLSRNSRLLVTHGGVLSTGPLLTASQSNDRGQISASKSEARTSHAGSLAGRVQIKLILILCHIKLDENCLLISASVYSLSSLCFLFLSRTPLFLALRLSVVSTVSHPLDFDERNLGSTTPGIYLLTLRLRLNNARPRAILSAGNEH